MADIKYYDVILKPVITEKSMSGMSEKKYVFLVRLIGMACLSPRLRILVEFLQKIYIKFMMVGLRPIPLLLRTR